MTLSKVKWPPTRGWKGHFESPGSYDFLPYGKPQELYFHCSNLPFFHCYIWGFATILNVWNMLRRQALINYLVVEPTDLKYMRSRQIGSFISYRDSGSYLQLSPFPPHSHLPGFLSRFSIVIPGMFLGRVNINPPSIFGFSYPSATKPHPGPQIQVQPCSYTIVVKQRGHRGQVPWFRWKLKIFPAELGYPDWRGGNQKSGIYDLRTCYLWKNPMKKKDMLHISRFLSFQVVGLGISEPSERTHGKMQVLSP